MADVGLSTVGHAGGMDIDAVIEHLESLDDVVVQRPGPGDGTPEIAWGDVFAYYSPDGTVPAAQPFATVVTKDYPGEPSSGLDRPGAFRVNVHAGTDEFERRTGHAPRDEVTDGPDPATPDVVMAHPVYGSLGWLAVVDPGPATEDDVRALLTAAHSMARARHGRRTTLG
jgi:hypothetical protein